MPKQQILYITNMVCHRCKAAVTKALLDLNWQVHSVEIGRAVATPPPGRGALPKLRARLTELGFTLRDRVSGPVSRIKGLIMQRVHDSKVEERFTLSRLISDDIGMSYAHLSRIFSKSEGRTIEDFYLRHRMERARRMLQETEGPIAEIAYRLNYASAAHFSATFKREHGMSPSQFRKLDDFEPTALDKL